MALEGGQAEEVEEISGCQQKVLYFFEETYNQLMTPSYGFKFRLLVLITASCLTIAPLVTSFFLSAAKETELHYYDQFVHWGITSNEETAIKKINDNNFDQINDFIEVKIVFGIQDIPSDKWKTPAEKWWAEESENELLVDRNFNLSSPESQQFMYDFCNRLHKRFDLIHQGQLTCWIHNFKQYLNHTGVEFPVKNNYQFYKSLQLWQEQYYSGFELQKNVIRHEETKQIEFTYITAITNAKFHDSSEVRQALWEKWENYMHDERFAAPPGLKTMFQASHEWATMTTMDSLYKANMQILLVSVFVSVLMQMLFNYKGPFVSHFCKITLKVIFINFLCTAPVILSLTFQPVLAGIGINSTANMMILAPMIQIVACLFSQSVMQNFSNQKCNYQVILLKETPVRAVIPSAYQNGSELNQQFQTAKENLKIKKLKNLEQDMGNVMRWSSLTLFNMIMFSVVTNIFFILYAKFMLYVVFFEQLMIMLLMWAIFFFLVWPTLFITIGLHNQLNQFGMISAGLGPQNPAAVNLENMQQASSERNQGSSVRSNNQEQEQQVQESHVVAPDDELAPSQTQQQAQDPQQDDPQQQPPPSSLQEQQFI